MFARLANLVTGLLPVPTLSNPIMIEGESRVPYKNLDTFCGWGSKVMDFGSVAGKAKNAFTDVDMEGELLYDRILHQSIVDEFQVRGHAVTLEQVKSITMAANGHSDYYTQIAYGCWALEARLNNKK